MGVMALVVVKFWLVAAQPLNAIGPAGHDDRLFLDLADHIRQGNWLGDYSQFTLMKGPMFSIWIAAVFRAGVPLPMANQALYLLACGAVVWALRPFLLGRLAVWGLFAGLWFNPMSFEMSVLGRVLRQSIYTPLSLLLWAAIVALITRSQRTRRGQWGLAMMIGAVAGCFYLTREESVWIVPALAVAVGYYGRQAIRARIGVVTSGLTVVVATATFALVVGVVCALNWHYYGWFGTVEFRAPEFRAAYGALQRVEVGAPVPHVPVTKAAREAAYAVSPAFAQLRPWLEGDIGLGWADASTPWTGHEKADLEISAGAFMWALRDAMMKVEAGRNAGEVLAHYGVMAAEINEAVDQGRLAGSERRDSFAPKLDGAAMGKLMGGAGAYFRYFVEFSGFRAVTPESVGDGPMLELFRDLTRWPHSDSPDAPEFRLPRQQRSDRGRVVVLGWIGEGYAAIMPWLTLVAGGVIGWRIWRGIRTGEGRLALMVSGSLLAAWVVSVGVNLAVHELAFYNLSPGAMAQAYPFLILFGVFSLFARFRDGSTSG